MTDQDDQEPAPAEDDGTLEPADSLETDDLAYDPLDTGIITADHYRSDSMYGLTANEAAHREPLDRHLAEEEPDTAPEVVDDRWADGPGPRAGRLEQDGTGLQGWDRGVDGGAASAEEAAVHLAEPDS